MKLLPGDAAGELLWSAVVTLTYSKEKGEDLSRVAKASVRLTIQLSPVFSGMALSSGPLNGGCGTSVNRGLVC